MKKFARFVFVTSKGVYDIVATYLLLVVVPFALAGFAFHLGFELLARGLDYESVEALWAAVGRWSPVPTPWLRIALFLPLHYLTFRLLRAPVALAWPHVERAFDQLVAAFRWMTDQLPALRVVGEWGFTLVVTALLVPFVVQPTLVPRMGTVESWVERTANLLDGTATAVIADSVVGLYRKALADPVVAEGLDARASDVFDQVEEVGEAAGPVTPPMPTGQQPLMDRWDPYIERVAEGDAVKFAYIKAFMWVESGGRQYAVSHTGCAGLMQFCVGTARTQPFKRVFGTGAVYRCDCSDGRCRFPREMQREMESGDPAALERHKKAFPCEMTDARFDPSKAIAAGGLYVDQLREAVGGNIYLMYIGYNSGPRIARAVYEKLGRNADASLSEIELHLEEALRPHYGAQSGARARSLVRTHLPKIKGAYDKYYKPPTTLASGG